MATARPHAASLFLAFSRAKTGIASAALSAWFVGLLVVGATLLARHVLALPAPSAASDGRLRHAIAALDASDPRVGGATEPSWSAVHVLYASCRCSERIAEHLAASVRPARLRETVLFIGHDEALEGALTSHGFRVQELSEDALATAFGIDAAPLFVIENERAELLYVGGYTERKQGLATRDLSIVRDLRAGLSVAPLPIFGCAVSRELREKTNPLALP